MSRQCRAEVATQAPPLDCALTYTAWQVCSTRRCCSLHSPFSLASPPPLKPFPPVHAPLSNLYGVASVLDETLLLHVFWGLPLFVTLKDTACPAEASTSMTHGHLSCMVPCHLRGGRGARGSRDDDMEGGHMDLASLSRAGPLHPSCRNGTLQLSPPKFCRILSMLKAHIVSYFQPATPLLLLLTLYLTSNPPPPFSFSSHSRCRDEGVKLPDVLHDPIECRGQGL